MALSNKRMQLAGAIEADPAAAPRSDGDQGNVGLCMRGPVARS
jgi:hypothetical protein